MKIIGIGGAGSGSGKTHVACELIRALTESPGASTVGALKYTPDNLYTSITDDPGVIGQEGKDTARMSEAGAAEVLLVRSSTQDKQEAMDAAMGRLSAHDVIVVEGNGAIEVLRPDIVVFVTGLPDGEVDEKVGDEVAGGSVSLAKPSARGVFKMADVVIYGGGQLGHPAQKAKTFRGDESGAYTAHILSLLTGAER